MSDRLIQPKSKTLSTWLALLLGSLGAHRFYLHGKADLMAWLHPLPTVLGLAGVLRMRNIGQDDHIAWLLIPLLGLMLAQSMLTAIVYGLTPDDKWALHHAAGEPVRPSGWGAVIGVVVALLLGGAILMGTLAFGGQKYFEYQQEQQAAADPAPTAQKTEKPTQ